MTTGLKGLPLVSAHPAAAAVCAVAALAAMFMLWLAGRRVAGIAGKALQGKQAEDVLTVISAAMATAVAMTGMWRFFGAVLHFSGAERVAMFAFLELAVVTCAFRARRNMRTFGSAGAEGIAVWVLSGLSAVFSALDARSGAEAVFRLAPPLVAAWLWHRAMSLEHRRASGRLVHWRMTTERMLVWLRLAEPSARTASDVDAHRRIARLARAAKRLRELRADEAMPWRQHRAKRQLDKAMEAAVEHADLAADPARQNQMRDQLGALNSAEALASLEPAAPWDRLDAESAEVARVRQEAAEQVRAARLDADHAAQARIQAAAREAEAVRAEAGRIAGAARARVTILEHEQAALRARAEAAERELQSACADSATPDAEPYADGPRRDALVAELAAEILTAAADSGQWRPDYNALMSRTGRQRRWCEYVVRDARSAVFESARTSARDPARAGQIVSANGHAPASGALN